MIGPLAIMERLAAEETARRRWLADLAARYGVIRLPASLTEAERTDQAAMLAWRLHLVFLPTRPLPGLVMDYAGQWHRTEPGQ